MTSSVSGGAGAFWGGNSNRLDDWLAIAPDGTVRAFSGKVELGTGVRTALAQIVAEELEVPFERVRMVMGDTALSPDEGFTAGSQTIHMGGSALRRAAAEARRALLDMASDRLDAAPEELTVRDGVILVSHRPDRSVSYGDLIGGKRFEREITGDAPVKHPDSYRIVGTSVPRVDLPPKVTGHASFVHDLRVEGMLHGRVVRPPSVGAEFVAFDEGTARNLPGLVRVVRHGNFVGVVAEREEQAVHAAQSLPVEWREAPALPRMEDQYELLRAQPATDNILMDAGDVESAMRGAYLQVQATYYQPYHAHASVGPSCAIADVREDGATVWCSTQGPFALRGALAQLLDLPPEKVHLVHAEGAGCYGQNGADDAAADAVLLSRAVGKPVRVQWSRADEFAWEPKAAPMVMTARGGLDREGRIIAWEYDAWTPSHSGRPRFAAQLLASQLMSGQPPPTPRMYVGGDRNAVTSYRLPNAHVTIHWLAGTPLRVSSFRGLGGTGNTFANESFMDELAAAAGADALEFRMRHLDDDRARAVLRAAAERAGWDARPSPRPTRKGEAEGRGLAFAQYHGEGAFIACVATVRVDTTTGAVRVTRVVAAQDCGLIINPDGVTNQIEGNIIQALSRALKEEVRYDRARITSVDWETYPILTFSEVPEIDVVLVNRPDQPAIGAGEPATVTTAAAVANAIFDATGARIRRVPFTPERVLQELRSPARQ